MDTTQRTTDGDGSVRELVQRLAEDTSDLVRQETTLARQEVEEKLHAAKKDLMSMSAGGAVLYAGILTLVATLVLVLALAMPLWVAALIVGLFVTTIGAGLVYFGKSRMEDRTPIPRKTVQSVKSDARRIQEATR